MVRNGGHYRVKIKATHVLYIINILTLVLILIIVCLPDNVLRIIIGLPFTLFFPGYTLIAALYPRKSDLDTVGKLALSFGLSIAVVPLIGLALNYTLGIRLNSILISLAVFIVVISVVAWVRQRRLPDTEKPVVNVFKPFWGKQNRLDKILSIVLIIAIISCLGTIGYVIAKPKVGEKFTEFYILGTNAKSDNYPTLINLGESGTVMLGIVNHEYAEMSYTLKMTIDGEPADIIFENESVPEIGPVTLAEEETWEREIGILPEHAGEDQKVELLLYKDGVTESSLDLHLWINVTANQ
jgi:uncharacterized membrane protein